MDDVANPAPDGNSEPTPAEKRAAVAERRERLVRLRAAGMTYGQLATRLGYSSPAAAAVDMSRALQQRREALSTEAANALILELERLDGYHQAAEAILGRARTSNDGELALKALDRLTKLSDRRVNLLGLSRGLAAPTAPDQSDELRVRRERRRRAAGG